MRPLQNNLFLCFLFLFSSPLWAQSALPDYPGPVFLYKEAKISLLPSCLSGGCQAKKWVDEGMTLPKDKLEAFPKSGGTNPAAIVCLYANGSPGSLQDSRGRSFSVCTFEDQSFIYSWDLANLVRE